ncbi:hypothetical protein KQX54_006313 [Cotesia glomerata]|uniref:Uncharacterized protein n=1 Tax=Cotesia glomerata TaxID=32391 RepID=A0AAV7I5X4_COTGL|nr:hypothetical protein KQX54_006313 [Cotesia glomerata]
MCFMLTISSLALTQDQIPRAFEKLLVRHLHMDPEQSRWQKVRRLKLESNGSVRTTSHRISGYLPLPIEKSQLTFRSMLPIPKLFFGFYFPSKLKKICQFHRGFELNLNI